MKNKVLNTIKDHNLIENDDNIVVGVSGGPDSMALLYILYELKSKLQFNIHVAHINHCVRGEESDGDELFVKNTCEKLDIPYYSLRVNMNEYAAANKLSSEEAGREIRYDFFKKLVNNMQAGKIAVAHNKNDQAETLLMRFMRGTGINGLKGMGYKNGNIIRPLLDISREEIEDYCSTMNISVRIDKTNYQPIYNRNKIRLELIPYIIENFNNGIIDTLSRTAKIMEEDSNFINSYSRAIFDNIASTKNNHIEINKIKFNHLHQAIKSRVLRISIEMLKGSIKGIEQKHIKEIITFIDEGTTGKAINLPGDMLARISYDSFIIEKAYANKEIDCFSYRLNINEATYIEELDSKIEASIINIDKCNLNYKNRFIKYLNYDKIKGDLHVRNRRDGDTFNPLGMSGTKKLKDFFIDEKIPKEIRNEIPLIVNNNNILWVVGYRIGEQYKITRDTKEVLVLKYIST